MRALASGCFLLSCVCISGCIELGMKGRSRAPARSSVVVVEANASRQGGVGTAAPTGAVPPTEGAPPTEDAPPTAFAEVPAGGPAPMEAVPLAVGEHHTCSLSPAGQVRCWGYNMQGQLGIGSTQHPGSGIVSGIGDASDGPVRSIAAGDYQTCALTAAGRVWCWGQNHEGQVGSGDASEAPVRTPTLVRGIDDVASLVLGGLTSCALTTAGELYCWGSNAQAQIDDSGRRRLTSPTRVAGIDRPDEVAVGNYHICALRGGRVTCRGSLARLAPQLATLDELSDVSAGWEHSCVLRRGVPYCFGKSYLGVLGRGRTCPQGQSANCDADVFYPPTAVPGVTGALEIGSHDYHSCVRLESGSVTCWGNNQGNAFADDLPAEPWQTAHPVTALGRVDAIFVGGTHICALRGDQPSCAGNDSNGAVRGAPAR